MVVHTFRTQVEEIGADSGYVVSSAGFQFGAHKAAEYTNIRLLSWDEFLDRFEPEGPPLAPGLRGRSQIVSGWIDFQAPDGSIMPFARSVITGGVLRRAPDGGLIGFVETEAPLPGLQEAHASIGWQGFELRSASDLLSTTSSDPTILEGGTEFTTPPGMPGLNPVTGALMTFEAAIHCTLAIQAEGSLVDGTKTFRGSWSLVAQTSQWPTVPLRGIFSMELL